MVVHNGGGIWVRDDDRALTERMVDFLVEQPWCGAVFTRDGIRGTLRLADVALDHERGPTIAMAMRMDDAANDFARHGTTRHDAPYPIGGGCHGGLSRYELNNFLSMAAARSKLRKWSRHRPETSTLRRRSGCYSVTTLPVNAMAGCCARRCATAVRSAADAWHETTIASDNANGMRTQLAFSTFDGAKYLDRAWVA